MSDHHQDQTVDFSIILPVYNVEKYIERCLRSCINQSYSNFEVIVVDDCGTDSSVFKAEKLAKTDSRIKIVRHASNKGTYLARKTGYEASSGQYILFLDPDDEITSNCLIELNSTLIKRRVDIIFFDVENVPKLKLKKRTKLPVDSNNQSELLRNIYSKSAKFNLGTPGKLYSRSALSRAYNKSYVPDDCRLVFAEDVLLLFLVCISSDSSSSICSPLYVYHNNDSSITQVVNSESIRFRSMQIDSVVYFITECVKNNKDISGKSDIVDYLVKRLVVDKLLYMRLCDSNDNSYLQAMKEVVQHRFSLFDYVRIFLFFSSFGKLRL